MAPVLRLRSAGAGRPGSPVVEGGAGQGAADGFAMLPCCKQLLHGVTVSAVMPGQQHIAMDMDPDLFLREVLDLLLQ